MFEVPVLLLLIGGLLLLIGIVGGGFEIKEIKIPKVGQLPRVISALGGILLISMAMSPETRSIEQTDPESAAEAQTSGQPAQEATTPAETPQVGGFERVASMTATEQEVVDQYREVVLRQLEEASRRFTAEGFSLYASDLGAIDQGASEAFQIYLEPGSQYAFVAYCDGDCTDVDLDLKDSGGSEISSDYLENDYPVVTANPSFEGSYQLTVHMAACSRGPCRYGVAAFER